MENKVSLVLEGGGLRGIYTSAILDYFLEKNIDFDYVVGVSAGAIMAASYFSKQIGRNLRINTKYLNDSRYMSFKNVLKEGTFFSRDFAYRKVPNVLEKFDYETFFTREFTYKVGAFDVTLGGNHYFSMGDIRDNEKFLDIFMASGSLPFLSKPVVIENRKYLDGGIGESIPIYQAEKDGYNKHIIILTRNKGYRKKEREDSFLIRTFYRKYPKVAKNLINRGKEYNKSLEYIEKLEKEGKAFVIRPIENVDVGRLEKNPEKIKKLYKQGRREVESIFNDLIDFLKN